MSNAKTPKSYWEEDSDSRLMHRLVGKDFGDDPLAEKDKIEKDKIRVAQKIKEYLKIGPKSVGLEIGSGIGLLTKHTAKWALTVHGCDISESFLNFAKRECHDVPNCFFTLIDTCDLSKFLDEKIDFIYSYNVFIHLDLYEIISYLEQSFQLLEPGGRMYFDFADAGRIDFSSENEFLETKNLKRLDPFHKGCVLHNCSIAIHRYAQHLGFKVISSNELPGCYADMLLEKPS